MHLPACLSSISWNRSTYSMTMDMLLLIEDEPSGARRSASVVPPLRLSAAAAARLSHPEMPRPETRKKKTIKYWAYIYVQYKQAANVYVRSLGVYVDRFVN